MLTVTVLEVEMFPRDRGVDVVVVDSGDDDAGLVAAAVTSAVSAADFDPKAIGTPPLLEVLPVTLLELEMFPRDRGVKVWVVNSGDDDVVHVAATADFDFTYTLLDT